MRNIYNLTVRFNLNRPEDRSALYHLRNMDRIKYKSFSRAVVAAVNDSFDRQDRLNDDPYLETREKEDAFLQRVQEAVERGVRAASANNLGGLAHLFQGVSPAPAPESGNTAAEESLDAAMDFIDSF